MFRAFDGPDGPFAGDDLKMKEIGGNDLNGIGMALGAATAWSLEPYGRLPRGPRR